MTNVKSMNKLFDRILDLVFPPRCEVCKKSGPEALCAECFAGVRFLRPQFGIHSAAAYDGVLKTAIHRFKFQKRKKLAEPLGVLMVKGNGGRQPVEVTRPDILPDELVDVTVRLPLSYWKTIVGAVGETLALPETKDAAPALARIHDALLIDGVPGARLLERGQRLEVK